MIRVLRGRVLAANVTAATLLLLGSAVGCTGSSGGSSGASASTAAATPAASQPATTTPAATAPSTPVSTPAPAPSPAPALPAWGVGETIDATVGYVALVNDGLETTVAPLLLGYQSRGTGVALVPLSHVTASGADRAEQIRNWLIAHCDDGVARYLLLVGGPASIPFRVAVPAASVGAVVTDLYYADLQGTWDSNGNGVYGEVGADQPNFAAQMFVGRIPFDDEASVATAIRAIENVRANRGAWSNHVLLAAGTIQVAGDAPAGALIMKGNGFDPNGWTSTTAFPSASLLPGDVTIDATTVVNQEQTDPAGLVVVISHGDTQSLVSNDSTGWHDLLTIPDLASFPLATPPILMAAACNAGDPSQGPCLGMLALQNGLAGFLGDTVTVNPLSGGGAGLQSMTQITSEIAQGIPIGIALHDTIRDYAANGLAATQGNPDATAEVFHEAMGGIYYGDPGLALGPHAK